MSNDYILHGYDKTLRNILKYGTLTENRTGEKAYTLYECSSHYNINEQFPLVSKRKINYKAAFAELIWILSGSTNYADLVKLGCNFWTPWVTLDNKENQDFYYKHLYPYGYLGPIYGFQLRHFGAKYTDYAKSIRYKDPGFWLPGFQGFDQLYYIINEIKTNPTSRRLLVSYWNPPDLHLMRLPPCHYAWQVHLENEYLSLTLHQRSCDYFVGGVFNIAFYSALTYLLAKLTNRKPYMFTHHIGNCHIYENQIEMVEEYLHREIAPSPTLKLPLKNDILDYKVDDFVIENYTPGPKISIPVAV